MQRQHRQERQEGAGHQHAEHVAEVGAGGHFDVFEHIGEGPAAFNNPFFQYHQALLQQDDIRRFTSNVHGAIDGNTDIRRAQRRGVVNAVAHKSHHVSFAFQQSHDTLFVQRRQARKQGGTFCQLGQFIIAQRFNLAADDHFTRIQTYFVADFGRHQLAVSGQDFDRNTAGLQRFQRRGCGLFRRIQKGDIAFKDQVGFIRALVVAFAGGQILRRHRHHAQSLTIEAVGHPTDAPQHGVVQRYDVAVIAHLGRDVEDLLQRPFADQLMNVALLLHHHRHAATLKIERDLIHFLPAFRQPARRLLFNAFQHCGIEQILQSGLIVAVQPGRMQHAFAHLAGDIGVVLQHDFILRQGTGFIGAQNVHRAKVLYRVEVLDDHFLF